MQLKKEVFRIFTNTCIIFSILQKKKEQLIKYNLGCVKKIN